jgi:hypothetical protein
MTKKKIAQPKRRTKRSAEKPVDQEIRRAARRVDPKGQRAREAHAIAFERSELESLDGMLAFAQRAAIDAAARPMSHVASSADWAIRAYDSIRRVRESLSSKALAGGAS